MYQITINKAFSAAHTLKEIGGKCENLHGHNFTVEVTVSAETLNAEGLVVDFRLLKGWTDEVLDLLDHCHLNDLPFFQDKNPSAENLARFIYDQLSRKVISAGASLEMVTVWESENARASYR
ncbi:MAG: 6-carboxytetrahydropterin synthase QueD [Smithellaceae bacterium]|nr:6-carboxytetrahydropterin synthase QueD [Smithellaceae bacterium]